MIASIHEEDRPAMAATDMVAESLIKQEQPLQENVVEALMPLKEELETIEAQRRRSSVKILDINVAELEDDEENEWHKVVKEESTHDKVEGTFASATKELSVKAQELLQVAACLDSFDMTLLEAATSLSDEDLARYLEKAAKKGVIIEDTNGFYVFPSDEAQRVVYGLIPIDKRSRFHAAIGRNLVRKLSHGELESHVSIVLLQFRRGQDAITNQSERNVVAALCLRGVRWAVAASDFRSACNYAELGILLLGQDCWKDEYTLSLTLYNASAEVLHCVGNYERMDSVVSEVLEKARCYQDTVQVRATRIYSLSSRYRMTEALEEALDTLHHLGERFPSKPKKYHVAIALLRTKGLLRGKTNEMIMRMPLMEKADKVAALQILNLIFPVAYHTNPMLNGLFATRMVQLTMNYGLSVISTVGFASFSSMLAIFYKNKEAAYQYSQLALELVEKFDAKEYIPRVYVFVYAEVLPHKRGLRELCTYLLQAYHIGLETGDIQFAIVAATMFEGYKFFSGDTLEPIEEQTASFCEVAVSYKQETALCLFRPELKLLQILTGKLERPVTSSAILKADLTRAEEAKDKATVYIIHCLQAILAYIFGDLETAADEAKKTEYILQLPYLHPGFSCLLTFYCLALLAVAPQRHGLARRRLLSAVKRSMKLLDQFALSVQENCLHSLNLVQAELAAVNGEYNLARSNYVISIAVATKFNDQMIHAIACERFASFLRARGDEPGAFQNYSEAHFTYKTWGATAKAQQLEEEMPELLSSK